MLVSGRASTMSPKETLDLSLKSHLKLGPIYFLKYLNKMLSWKTDRGTGAEIPETRQNDTGFMKRAPIRLRR